jgi:hypothetical protein
MLKKIRMVVGLDGNSIELDLQRLIDLLCDDLSPIVFSDNPITKMYDSLPMVLFRFEIILKLYEARELGQVAYFFPRVLVNEAMSHPQDNTRVRVECFNIAYCYLIKCTVTYHDWPAGSGIKPFGTKGGEPDTRRILFDRKLMMHATNTIAAVVYEIRNAKPDISLRRDSTTPLENRFGQITIIAGVHQKVSAIIKTMEIDEAVKFLYSQRAVKNRRLEYGEIVSPLEYIQGLWFSSLIHAESLLCVVGFSMTLSQLVLDQGENGIHIAVERLMSDILRPFARINFIR